MDSQNDKFLKISEAVKGYEWQVAAELRLHLVLAKIRTTILTTYLISQ